MLYALAPLGNHPNNGIFHCLGGNFRVLVAGIGCMPSPHIYCSISEDMPVVDGEPNGTKVELDASTSSIPSSMSNSTSSLPTSPMVPSQSMRDLPSPVPLHERRQMRTLTTNKKNVVASSRHGVIEAKNLEPFQCVVVSYTSSYSLPHAEKRIIARYYPHSLAPSTFLHWSLFPSYQMSSIFK